MKQIFYGTGNGIFTYDALVECGNFVKKEFRGVVYQEWGKNDNTWIRIGTFIFHPARDKFEQVEVNLDEVGAFFQIDNESEDDK